MRWIYSKRLTRVGEDMFLPTCMCVSAGGHILGRTVHAWHDGRKGSQGAIRRTARVALMS